MPSKAGVLLREARSIEKMRHDGIGIVQNLASLKMLRNSEEISHARP
jgi:hypothetical protein